MIQSLNRRIGRDSSFGHDLDIEDEHNYCIKQEVIVEETLSDNEDSIWTPNDRSDEQIEDIPKDFRCDNTGCEKGFTSAMGLRLHKTDFHSSPECLKSKDNDFRGCKRGFTSNLGLKVHKRKCDFSKSCDSNLIYKTIETNVENKQNSRNSEANHNISEEDHPFSCDITGCGKTFPSIDDLEGHTKHQ